MCSQESETGDAMQLTLEVEQEEDGRWIAEVPEIPGAMVYGPTRAAAMAKAEALALRALAERLEHGEATPMAFQFLVAAG
jgi:predicted RNase H-like HicB family nuclease